MPIGFFTPAEIFAHTSECVAIIVQRNYFAALFWKSLDNLEYGRVYYRHHHLLFKTSK
jgi:hypothetical protein